MRWRKRKATPDPLPEIDGTPVPRSNGDPDTPAAASGGPHDGTIQEPAPIPWEQVLASWPWEKQQAYLYARERELLGLEPDVGPEVKRPRLGRYVQPEMLEWEL